MKTLPVKPERLAQLQEYAGRHGKSVADALDDAFAEYLDWERQDFQQAVECVRRRMASNPCLQLGRLLSI